MNLENISKQIQADYGCIVIKSKELYYNNFPMWYDVYNILIHDTEISFLKIDNIDTIYRIVDIEGNCYDYNNIIDMKYKIVELLREVL